VVTDKGCRVITLFPAEELRSRTDIRHLSSPQGIQACRFSDKKRLRDIRLRLGRASIATIPTPKEGVHQ